MALKFLAAKLKHPCHLSGFLALPGRCSIKMRKCSTENESLSDETDEEFLPFFHFKYINEVRLLGFVGCDPNQVSSVSVPFTTFSVATSKYFRDNTGGMKQITNWHYIIVRDISLQNYVSKYITKGTRAYVSGSLSCREHNSELSSPLKNGTWIVADQVICLRKSKKEKFEL